MTIEEVKSYYSGLLIKQYRSKPKAIATIKLLANTAFADGIILNLARAFDIDTAVGAQLDIIGRIVGVERNVKNLDLGKIYVQLARYTETPAGIRFGKYTDATYVSGRMSHYYINSFYTLSDFQMRYLIKIKIIQNCTNMTTKYLTEALYAVFEDNITITDNKDMTMDIDVAAGWRDIYDIADYVGAWPYPMGVTRVVNYA
jgi:hypothetical protein